MPITIKQLVEEVGLSSTAIEVVKWNTPIDCKKEGVYIVSLSENAELNRTIEELPISMTILEAWIKKFGYFTIDKEETHDAGAIKRRLAEFWIPDENILYIGKAPLRKSSGGIGNRVREYYKTAIGEAGPHAGGHWIKMLKNLNDLHVFYVECQDSGAVEAKMLSKFGELISDNVRERLFTKGPILPFANLEGGKGKGKKKHGLGHMKKIKKRP